MRKILDEISTITLVAIGASVLGMLANAVARCFIEVTCYNEDTFDTLLQICVAKLMVEVVVYIIVGLIDYIVKRIEDSRD